MLWESLVTLVADIPVDTNTTHEFMIGCGFDMEESNTTIEIRGFNLSLTADPSCSAVVMGSGQPRPTFFTVIDVAAMLTLRGFSFRNGNENAIAVVDGALVVVSCSFQDFRSTAILIRDLATLIITDCEFRDNTGWFGGAIFIDSVYNPEPEPPIVSISGCSFTNTSAIVGGALYISGGAKYLVSNCTFTDSTSITDSGKPSGCCGGQGGAIYLDTSSPSPVIIANSTFESSLSLVAPGGAISAQGSDLIITGCSFKKSTSRAAQAGAIMIWGNDYGATRQRRATISGCTFADSTSSAPGGAISIQLDSKEDTIIVANCSFTNSVSLVSSGGAIAMTSNGNLTLVGCTFAHSQSPAQGGAIWVGLYNGENVSTTINGCSFTNSNSIGANGGAITINAGPASITNTAFSYSSAYGQGGAVYFSGTHLALSGCTFEASRSGGAGGAASCAGQTAIITNCSFTDNTATGSFGGALSCTSDSAEITSCTFSGNTCTGCNAGGGALVLGRYGAQLAALNFIVPASPGFGSNDLSGLAPTLNATFTCPPGKTGAPVKMQGHQEKLGDGEIWSYLAANELPPHTEVVHCN
jgi:predicted outer membrane repeat protein